MNSSEQDHLLSAREAAHAQSQARPEIEARGVESLRTLYEAACGHSGQCRVIAAFLLGLYNGSRFPFNLTDLRMLDSSLFEHCIRVLHMDARVCRQEVHAYLDDGGRKFEELARQWRIIDHERVMED